VDIVLNGIDQDPKTPVPQAYGSSPEVDYFRASIERRQQVSRWKEDWEELELLVSVVCRSTQRRPGLLIDSRVGEHSARWSGMYLPMNAHSDTFPVKKVRLRTPNTDNKILREINALSRLSHRFIVRYYTAWFEDSESASATLSSDGSGDDTADGVISVLSGIHRRDGSSDPFSIDLDDLESESRSSTSFPSIHFTGSGSGATEGSDADDIGEMFEAPRNVSAVIDVVPRVLPPSRPRTLYIQMVSSFSLVSVTPKRLCRSS